jgi:predicted MFS family arabinose efflux permease
MAVVPSALASPFRSILLILAVSGFAGSFSSRTIDPMIGVMARDFAAAPSTVALLSAAFALPYALIQPVLGPIGDALGKERVMLGCLTLLLLALGAAAVAPNIPSLFVARSFAGAAAGGAIPLSLALIGDRVPAASRQVALSRYMVAVIAGQLSGSSLAGLLAQALGWRGVFVLSAVLMALALAATWVGFRHAAPGRPLDVRGALQRYREILSNRRALALFALVFVEGTAFFGLFPYLAPVIEAAGGTAANTGLAIAGFAIGGLLFSFLVPWLLSTLGLSRMVLAGAGISALAMLGAGFTGDWRLLCAILLVMGLGYNTLHNSFQARATELSSSARASAVALFIFFFFCGQGSGVLLMGAGLAHIGFAASLAVAALAVLGLGVGAASMLRR